MGVILCPQCERHVVPNSNRTCPACGEVLDPELPRTKAAMPAEENHGRVAAEEDASMAIAPAEKIDPGVRAAVEVVHQALMSSNNARYADLPDPQQWQTQPTVFQVKVPRAFTLTEWSGAESWAVVPWITASAPGRSDCQDVIAQLRDARSGSAPDLILLVTFEKLDDQQVAGLSQAAGCPVVAICSENLDLAGNRSDVASVNQVAHGFELPKGAGGDVQSRIEEFHAALVDQSDFDATLKTATPTVWVVPVLLGINLLVFLAMVVADPRSISSPTIESLLNWGALFGPLTVHGEPWRLLTSNYIHIGIMHLGFNMWCLWGAGRLAERLFGNGAFLVLYILSGLGGAVASLGWNPIIVSAGASGAVFGVFGGIAGFMLIRSGTISKTILRPLLGSTMAFICYNLFFGLINPWIDNAAHLGGLCTGFLCGMVLSRTLPAPSTGTPAGRYARVGLVALLVLGGFGWAAKRVSTADSLPQFEGEQVSAEFNTLIQEASPVMGDYDRVFAEYNRLMNSLEVKRAEASNAAEVSHALEQLADRANSNRIKILEIAVRHEEIKTLVERLALSLDHQSDGMRIMAQAVRQGNEGLIKTARQRFEAGNAAIGTFKEMRDALFKKYGLELIEP